MIAVLVMVCCPPHEVRTVAAPISARVQPEVGRAIDVSALSDLDLLHALNVAQDREPALMAECSANVPPGSAYALLELFTIRFEASKGEPFRIDGGHR